jgi:CDP-6-deoxy-D-xylo-4-hexulose-3-dehydrase
MIPLIRNTFIEEEKTKRALADFIVSTNKFSMGEKCYEFEKKFAEKQGRKEAVLVNSGGSANLLLLQALKNLGELKTGDKIGFSAVTWSTNVMPIIQHGMIPIAIDCEIETLNISSKKVLQRLEETDIQALFLTNALGFAGDLEVIKKLCDEKGIILLEDNCESLGTELFSGKTGNFGEASTFSFFVAHHMSTIEGGMICTDNEKLAEMLRISRANGWDRNLEVHQQTNVRRKHEIPSDHYAKYAFYDLGFNLRPTEITGFIGLCQLNYLENTISSRSKNFLKIQEAIRNNPDFIPVEYTNLKRLSPFAIPFICKTTELFNFYADKFTKADIEIRPMIAGNIQKQVFYKKYVAKMYDLPNSNFLHENSFYCGNFPEMTEEDMKIIIDCINQK